MRLSAKMAEALKRGASSWEDGRLVQYARWVYLIGHGGCIHAFRFPDSSAAREYASALAIVRRWNTSGQVKQSFER